GCDSRRRLLQCSGADGSCASSSFRPGRLACWQGLPALSTSGACQCTSFSCRGVARPCSACNMPVQHSLKTVCPEENSMTEHVKTEIESGILTLTLARPDKKNALTNEMYGVLADALENAEKDPAVRVVLLQADGDMFTAGNDVGAFARQSAGEGPKERHVTRFLHALARASRPLVAAVQGRAVGVGTTMLLHCDLVVVAEGTLLTTPFVNLALVPEAASSLLMPARIGYARAFEMFALGEAVTAENAVAWGLANRMVPAGELRATARDFAERLARQPV